MNRMIKILMLSDIFVLTGFGLTDPIFAIFIKENLTGGNIFFAGLASTLFLITKNIVQLPFSRYVDKHDDKVTWLIVGTFLITITPFIYLSAKDIMHIYFAQFIHGIGCGLAYPTWLGLWSTHLDKKHESFEWSLYSTYTGAGVAITASVGAAIAQYIGFRATFCLVGLMSLIGCLVLFALEMQDKKGSKINSMHYHRKRFIHNKRWL